MQVQILGPPPPPPQTWLGPRTFGLPTPGDQPQTVNAQEMMQHSHGTQQSAEKKFKFFINVFLQLNVYHLVQLRTARWAETVSLWVTLLASQRGFPVITAMVWTVLPRCHVYRAVNGVEPNQHAKVTMAMKAMYLCTVDIC